MPKCGLSKDSNAHSECALKRCGREALLERRGQSSPQTKKTHLLCAKKTTAALLALLHNIVQQGVLGWKCKKIVNLLKRTSWLPHCHQSAQLCDREHQRMKSADHGLAQTHLLAAVLPPHCKIVQWRAPRLQRLPCARCFHGCCCWGCCSAAAAAKVLVATAGRQRRLIAWFRGKGLDC
eukprot:1160827-Pelagomonas_calceolata.AAC.16